MSKMCILHSLGICVFCTFYIYEYYIHTYIYIYMCVCVLFLQAAKASGGLTLQRLLEMEEQGIVVGDVTSDELRASLYTKEVRGGSKPSVFQGLLALASIPSPSEALSV